MGINKKLYNDTLMRLWKATAYMDSEAKQEEKEKWLPEYVKLLETVNSMVAEQLLTGKPMTENEILYGFQGVEI